MNKTLADLMTRHARGVATTTPLGEAAGQMAAARISSLLITEGGQLAGILTERDLLRALRARLPASTPVHKVMSAPVLTAPETLDYHSAYHLISRHGVRHLVVVDGEGNPIGIVSESDFRSHLGGEFFTHLRDVSAHMDRRPATLPLSGSLAEALTLMEERRASCIIVVDHDRPMGILTERDVVRLYRDGTTDATVGELMSRPLATIDLETPLDQAAVRMQAGRFRHLAVVDEDGRLRGILGEHDLVRPLELEVVEQAYRERRDAEERWHFALDGAALGVWDWDAAADAVYYSSRWKSMLGYADADIGNTPAEWDSRVHPDDLPAVRAALAHHLAGGNGHYEAEYRMRCKDGGWKWIHARGKVVARAADGMPLRLVGTHSDVTERRQMEEQLRLAASVFAHAHEGIIITDVHGRILDVNSTFTELTGYSRDEAVGRNPSLLKSGRHDAAFYTAMWQALARDGYWRGEVWNRKKDGGVYAELLTISAVRDAEGQPSHYVAVFSDITALKESQRRLEHMAYYDALTQLPNRSLLADRMRLALAQAVRDETRLAVCYLDLDGFKPVNDEFGHAVGDRLLVDVASRLRGCVRAADTISRLGGDEFVILLGGITSIEECDHTLVRILNTLAAPFGVADRTLSISASIGVTLYPDDGADPDTLLRHADQAMYAAKQSGRNRYHLFDPEHDRRARAHREALARIEAALAAGEFRLHYQPKVDMRHGRVVGSEALIRWQHPQRGLLPPAEFLPLVEETDFAATLGQWVLAEAVRQMAAWAATGLVLPTSVNISPRHLQQRNFVPYLSALLADHPDVPPAWLQLEILETTALEDMSFVSGIIEECRRLGVSFALDDFGTGYSSLTYFKRLPAKILKIDQSFVRDMLEDPEDMAIVEGVIGLTTAFNREVIAEGVETPEHGMLLLQLGCDLAQGYGIARPMPAEQIAAWTRDFRPDPLWASTSAFRWPRGDLPMLAVEVEHKRWVDRVTAAVDTERPEDFPYPVHHAECRFGRWYYGVGANRHGDLEAFRQLEPVHTQVHRVAQELLELAAVDADAARRRLPELTTLRQELLERLHALQAEVIVGGGRSVS